MDMSDKNQSNGDGFLNNFKEIKVTRLKRIKVSGGDVKHYLRSDDPSFSEFGEVYFSQINFKEVKAWKKHKRMTLNLAVPMGNVKFVFWNEITNTFRKITIGDSAYNRITVGPGVWFGFTGLSSPTNLIASFTDIIHDSNEVDRREISDINFLW
jgi:dTDP-4-dehydrorhamnose 3,5-epimerase